MNEHGCVLIKLYLLKQVHTPGGQTREAIHGEEDFMRLLGSLLPPLPRAPTMRFLVTWAAEEESMSQSVCHTLDEIPVFLHTLVLPEILNI
jgi:hypothetical protein